MGIESAIPLEGNYDSIATPIESHPVEDNLSVNTELNWTSTRLGKIAAATCLAIEVLPTNELIRYGATIAAQATLHNPAITGSVLAGSHFIVEGGGSLVAADYIAAGGAGRPIKWLNQKLQKYTGGRLKTNLPIEASVALVPGVPATIFLKQIQDRERTRHENRRYGLLMSLGTAAILGANAYAVSAGIDHPSPETIGGATFALGIVYGAYRWAKRRFTSSNANELSDSGEYSSEAINDTGDA